MKKSLLISFLAILSPFVNAVCQENNYTLYGKLADHSMDGSYLSVNECRLFSQESILIDSVKVENGQFVFSGHVDKPCLMYVANAERAWGRFIAEPGEIRISFDPAKDYLRANISGTPINDDYQKLIIEPRNAYRVVMGPLNQKRKAGLKAGTWTSDDETAYYDAQPGESKLRTYEKQKVFIDKYIRNEEVVQEQLFLSLIHEADKKRFDKDFEGLLEEDELKYKYADENARWLSMLSTDLRRQMIDAVKEHEEMMKQIAAKIKSDKTPRPKIKEVLPESVQEGERFTDFSGTTADGKPFSLKQAVAENKLVMLDFWASWCLPCLKMMPEVAALHEKYKDRGLLVVGISSDTMDAPWRKAMEKFKMVWPQVRSAEKGRVGEIYGIRTIPYAILIDHNGTIVARNLRGEELAAKIAEILE